MSPRERQRGKGARLEADVSGSFRAMSRLRVQTSHGQHTKHRIQCPDPDLFHWHTNLKGEEFLPPKWPRYSPNPSLNPPQSQLVLSQIPTHVMVLPQTFGYAWVVSSTQTYKPEEHTSFQSVWPYSSWKSSPFATLDDLCNSIHQHGRVVQPQSILLLA